MIASCDHCGKPLEHEELHWDHESDCRRKHYGHNASCTCDLVSCAACCGACRIQPAHTNPRSA